MQKVVNPFAAVIPMAMRAIISGFIAWCATHGYCLTVIISGAFPNEEQMEALVDDFIKQGIQSETV